jgi:hypothetical protein
MQSVRLPGGLVIDGIRHRTAFFRPLTGAVELAIAEARETNELYPAFVARILSAAVASVGTVHFTDHVAKALCVADRQVLLKTLLIMLGKDRVWMQPWCPSCGQRFDVPITYSQLPIVDAPGDYPVFQGKVGTQTIGLRVLTGEAEQRLSTIEDEGSALAALIEYAVDWRDKKPLQPLTGDELYQIEQQLEEGSPAIAEEVMSQCPYCQTDVKLTLDFIAGLLEEESILQDIHQIAMHYHWSQEAITALPRQRRKQYLKMIHAAKGMEA